jgi:hypothetical protein
MNSTTTTTFPVDFVVPLLFLLLPIGLMLTFCCYFWGRICSQVRHPPEEDEFQWDNRQISNLERHVFQQILADTRRQEANQDINYTNLRQMEEGGDLISCLSGSDREEGSSSENSGESECVVCLRKIRHDRVIKDSNYAVEIGCGHHFHRHCLVTWEKRKATCPICREQISHHLNYLPIFSQGIVECQTNQVVSSHGILPCEDNPLPSGM